MPIDTRQELLIAEREITTSFDMIEAAKAANKRALTAVQTAIKGDLKQGLDALPVSEVAITAHRKQHRTGRPAKIDTDPELQAFIRARIDRLTYLQTEREIAAYFPPNRRVSRSSIQRWWQRQIKLKTQATP